jgi:hypothetical protein
MWGGRARAEEVGVERRGGWRGYEATERGQGQSIPAAHHGWNAADAAMQWHDKAKAVVSELGAGGDRSR